MPNCAPDYLFGSPPDYVPTFVASSAACQMDVYQETRARSPVGLGGTFFRSKNAGEEQNLISIELIYDGTTEYWTLIVRNDGVEVETFGGASPPTIQGDQTPPGDPELDCSPNLFNVLRTEINGVSEYIEMPVLDYGGVSASGSPDPIFDVSEVLLPDGGDDRCLEPFPETLLSGGTGAPSVAPPVTGDPPESQPRTGPERTIHAVMLSEIVNNDPNDDGRKYEPPANQKVRQWNGFGWVYYVPGSDC